jgi:hypothetical protein
MSIEKVTARFWVRLFQKHAYANRKPGQSGWAEPKPLVTVTLNVVSGNRAPENQQWATATPQGEITMTIGNPEAAAWFERMLEEGNDIAVTFEARPADELQ